MKANIIDLRYKMNKVLKALEHNETVTILYHGKEKGVIIPFNKASHPAMSVKDHPFFGSSKKDVTETINKLRAPRYDAF